MNAESERRLEKAAQREKEREAQKKSKIAKASTPRNSSAIGGAYANREARNSFGDLEKIPIPKKKKKKKKKANFFQEVGRWVRNTWGKMVGSPQAPSKEDKKGADKKRKAAAAAAAGGGARAGGTERQQLSNKAADERKKWEKRQKRKTLNTKADDIGKLGAETAVMVHHHDHADVNHGVGEAEAIAHFQEHERQEMSSTLTKEHDAWERRKRKSTQSHLHTTPKAGHFAEETVASSHHADAPRKAGEFSFD